MLESLTSTSKLQKNSCFKVNKESNHWYNQCDSSHGMIKQLNSLFTAAPNCISFCHLKLERISFPHSSSAREESCPIYVSLASLGAVAEWKAEVLALAFKMGTPESHHSKCHGKKMGQMGVEGLVSQEGKQTEMVITTVHLHSVSYVPALTYIPCFHPYNSLRDRYILKM